MIMIEKNDAEEKKEVITIPTIVVLCIEVWEIHITIDHLQDLLIIILVIVLTKQAIDHQRRLDYQVVQEVAETQVDQAHQHHIKLL